MSRLEVAPPPDGLEFGALDAAVRPTSHAEENFLPAATRNGIALCLSGGGYRAALFHLGSVRRLNELGVLGKLDAISSVSGGSILAAHLAASIGHRWPAPGESVPNFVETVVRPFHRFCSRNIRTGPLLRGLVPWNVFRGHAAVDALEGEYYEHLTQQQLHELPTRPHFVFCATDLAYGVNWVFERTRVGSYQAGYANPPDGWSVARAVAASSCFPPFFNPQPIALDPGTLTGGHDDSGDRDARVRTLALSDGGLYDNLGLEPVWKRFAVVLVSDGGATFDPGADEGLVWRLNRYSGVLGAQSGAIRKRWLISSYASSVLAGTYWGVGSVTASYDVPTPGYPRDVVDQFVSEVRTDLDAFSAPEQAILENHGYLMAEAAMLQYAQFLTPGERTPLRVPHPAWMDPGRVRDALADSHRRMLPFGRR